MGSSDKQKDNNKRKKLPSAVSKMENVQEVHDYYQKIINCMPNNVYWLDRNCIAQGCNENVLKFIGLKDLDDFVGLTYEQMAKIANWKDNHAELYRQDDMEVMSTGVPKLNIEDPPIYDENGEPTYYLSSRVPLFDEKNNQVVGVVGISVDITNLKKLENDLKASKSAAESANIAKTEFIANMSHDIRTPLSGVVGLGSMAEKEIINPEARSKVHDMVKSADELLNMLNEILDVVTKDNISVKDIHEEPFDLSYLVQAIVNVEKASVDLKKIDLQHVIDTKIPSVLFGDHKKIHHILLNLVGNAIKFTEKGLVGIKIKLSKRLKNTVKLLFEITDTGQGIPKESLEQIFELFYKITPSYKGLKNGHGIGLHIAKTYVELLDGKINVASKLHCGSKFSFSLMLKIADKNAKPRNIIDDTLIERSEELPLFVPPSEEKELTTTSTKNAPEVLIIEDNDIARKVVKSLIKEAKCNPIVTADGESGLDIAKSKNFSLILTDIGLPGISGIEFAKQYRKHEKQCNNKPVPIVAITGHAEGKMRDECIAAGINEVIIKPIRPEILDKIITQFALFNNSEKFTSSPDESKNVNVESDLPKDEAELFFVDNEMIFDIKSAKKILGDANTDLLMQMLKETINKGIPEELARLQKAHAEENWQAVADISHKLKGGFLSISLSRAATACKYLERYHKTGKTELLEKLYQQVLKALEDTSSRLKDFTK